ncbi:acetylornithine deacetylase/succinyl-diaminopimelate desuccinylase-like protein [Polymorphobacter multimanifer]|uniref:Acetylornithine deacetylase/succinyl-diaminopimelate desuccinylase-like protein n=1 Tax=Polymorphobacter multimanifer TaxID=1070431 RepID=A0A841L2B9_9SPHN|nr:M20/M25/M40 family metallo-hydrolase [Polymorphobacter multimanifer]MBB6226580.1 acetylornithine deacetylase/succinyl-diaminopimelate desuccinylase-like protein [Polymorphobacter multimanifer]
MNKIIALATVAVLAAPAAAQELRPDQVAFRDLYREMIETNTALSVGGCTDAAQKIAVRLKAAGFADADVTMFATPENPKEGGLVAILQGRDSKAKPILLLAHLDVVEAKREDWTRDPFKMIDEGGYYYGRGTVDDKPQVAIFTDTLIRYKAAGKVPKRTLKLALTCGEETTYAFNGAEWLARNKPELIAAEFALNEGGGGRLDAEGKPQGMAVQVGEKTVQNFQVEATNPGGHSSVPRADNAITDLSMALVKINTHRFPTQFNDTTRAYFTTLAGIAPAPVADAIRTLMADPENKAANDLITRDPLMNSTTRTSCVSTLISAGHANNALPQRATANVNCRIFPGITSESVMADLVSIIGNPAVKVTMTAPIRPIAVSPPLNPAVMDPIRKVAAKHFPGVPVTITMSTGGTDAPYLALANIPTYGIPGMFIDPDGNGVHGLNERMRINVLMKGRDYIDDLVHTLAD